MYSMQLFFVVLLAILTIFAHATPEDNLQCADVATTDYPAFGIPATTIAIAVLNSLICGIIARLIFSVAERAAKSELQTQ